jgi:hypothetical protein
MKKHCVSLVGVLAGAFAVGCGPIPNPEGGAPPDLRPPSVLSVGTIGPHEVEIVFDEEARLRREELSFQPELAVGGVFESAGRVVLNVDGQEPGALYTMRAVAEDARGNSVSFLADFYGFNPLVPALLLNELTPRGSSDHPDLLECRVLEDGDMGGVVLYQGTPGGYQNRLIFPSFAVRAGDFILVHFKPSGDPAEKDETLDKTASGGIDASENAFDFWIRDGTGLSGNNGVLSLYERPGGPILDGVLYSNGVTSPDRQYRGFGTAQALSWAEGLVADLGWKTAGEVVAPEDGVNPDASTATRSICRSSDSADTDTREDWHIVPTRKYSFGGPNSDEVYSP